MRLFRKPSKIKNLDGAMGSFYANLLIDSDDHLSALSPPLPDGIKQLQEETPQLSVIIPVKNEAGNIGPLIDEVRTALGQHYAHEIIVINDGSTDTTMLEIQARGSHAGSALRVIELSVSRGQSTGVRLGTEQARAPLIATLDGDRQNDPADLPAMAQYFADASDQRLGLVQGVRGQRNDSWVRVISSKVSNAVRAWALGDDFPDSGCGIKVFRRDAALRLPYFDHMHRFMPALFRLYGFEVKPLQVHHRAREVGESKYGLFDRLWVGIVDLIGMWWLRSRYRLPAAMNVIDIEELK